MVTIINIKYVIRVFLVCSVFEEKNLITLVQSNLFHA